MKLGELLKETNDDLQTVYGDFALTYPCVRKCFLQFADNRGFVEDDAWGGRPVTVKTSKLIADVEGLVYMEDRRITVPGTEEAFNISYGKALEILTQT